MIHNPKDVLRKYFGYTNFRPGQEELVSSILAGVDSVGGMPTGAGKSLCFQLPALMMPGATLVVSPLISLMKDQVNALIQMGVRGAYINTSLTEGQIRKALENARAGMYKIIYIAPERLMSHNFIDFAKNAKISMLTIDEAHCISQWGHDFRPHYSHIPQFLSQLPYRPVVSAFTATATPLVCEDITYRLQLNSPKIMVSGFDRPNLHFEVMSPKDKFLALIHFLRARKSRTGIVYCNTRKRTETVCYELQAAGYEAVCYHGGMDNSARGKAQDEFLYDRAQIMVATTAFGMGIDKSNVSFVVHYNMPLNLENYYQEAGRAGRDGSPAECLLLYGGQDVNTNLWLINNSGATEQIIAKNKEKLWEMRDYCMTENCLRSYILRYFGENPAPKCENCANCLPETETKAAIYTSKPKSKRSHIAAEKTTVNIKLLAKLKELRITIAKEQGMPAFVIFHDSTLIDMCLKLPKTPMDFLGISGVGARKAEAYGERFLAEIVSFWENN